MTKRELLEIVAHVSRSASLDLAPTQHHKSTVMELLLSIQRSAEKLIAEEDAFDERAKELIERFSQ